MLNSYYLKQLLFLLQNTNILKYQFTLKSHLVFIIEPHQHWELSFQNIAVYTRKIS